MSEVSHLIDLKTEQMTSRTQILTSIEATEVIEKSTPRSQVVRVIDGDDELKYSRTRPVAQFKNVFGLNQNKT